MAFGPLLLGNPAFLTSITTVSFSIKINDFSSKKGKRCKQSGLSLVTLYVVLLNTTLCFVKEDN